MQDTQPLTSPEKFQIARLRVIKGMKDGGFLTEEDYNKERMKIIDNMVGLSPRKQSAPNVPTTPSSPLLTLEQTSTPSTPKQSQTMVEQSKYTRKAYSTNPEELESMKQQFKDFKIMILAKFQILEEGYLLHFKSMKTLPTSEQIVDLNKRIDQVIEQFSAKVASLSLELTEFRTDLEKRNQSDYDNKLIEIEEEISNIALHTHERLDEMDHKISEVESSNVDIYKKLGETVTLFTNQNELSNTRVGETEKKVLEEFENFKTQAKYNKEKDFATLESKIKISMAKMKENLESSQEEALSNMDSELFVIKQRMGVEEVEESDKDPVQILNSIKLGVVEQMKSFESKLEEIAKPQPATLDYASLIPALLSRIDSLEEKVRTLEKQ